MRALYRLLTIVLSPLWLLYLAVTQGRQMRLLQRLGFAPRRKDAPVWIQAVSVGEVRIALRLAGVLRQRGLPVVISSTTAAGLSLAQAEGGPDVGVCAFPMDLPGTPGRALGRLGPRAVVMVETELWPGLFARARRQSVPVFIVNGRLSDRSFRRTMKFRSLFGPALRDVHVAAQSEEHAARFRELGAQPERVVVLGNLKYDLKPPASFEATVEALSAFGGGPPLWVAGSVREGEEALVLEAHRSLRENLPSAKLVMAPRHLSRVSICEAVCDRLGLDHALRSRGPSGAWDVLLLDTMGELWAAYALGAAAFVGGSLVPMGGQNVIEPAFLKKPTLFGPHTENFCEDAERLAASGGGFRVENPAELAWRLRSLLSDPDLAASCGLKAFSAVERHRGAVDRTACWLAEILPGV